MLRFHAVYPMVCPICGQQAYTKRTFQNHFKRRHPWAKCPPFDLTGDASNTERGDVSETDE